MNQYLFTNSKTPDGPKRVDGIAIKWIDDYAQDMPQFSTGDKRLESYEKGEWNFIGCIAEAIVSYPIGNGYRRLEKLTSVGFWGIESDSDDEYLKSVEKDQLEDLKNHLKILCDLEIPKEDPFEK